jgi:[protein-PII] uridylyltransferase
VDESAARVLSTVRAFLHFRTSRDQNLLDFESQDALAAAPFSAWTDPAEWMRAWYRNASTIWLDVQSELEAAEAGERSMLSNFRDWRSRLSNSEFTVSRDLIFLRNPHELSTDEALPLRLFEFIARHRVSPARQSERRVSAHVAQYVTAFAARPVRAKWWRTFLSLGSPALALRSMRACGFLTAILPEWARIEHLVVRDFYHHYTVDEHTFVTLESIEDLSHKKEGPTQRFATILDESRGDAWMLLLALLMHDIGKGSGGGHERKSVELATVVLVRAGFSEEERATILFLVAHHLDLSTLLMTHDLSDPATARHAAAIVETAERLRLLTLMTLADINAVNPSALTPWRLEQLWRLYRVTQREINRELGEEPAAPLVAPTGDPVLAEFLHGLPKRYLFTHTEEQARAQAELYADAKLSGAALRIEKREGFYRLTVVAADRPFLFASIAGGLSGFHLNILKAEAFHNRQGFIADAFVFSDPHHNLELNPSETDRLHERLMMIIRGEATAEQFLRSHPASAAPARSGAVEPAVTLDSDTSESATVFEVVAQDRAGLLHALAGAISRAECNIEVVLVQTEAHRAIDVFHVTRQARKLDDEHAALLRAALLSAAAGDTEG